MPSRKAAPPVDEMFRRRNEEAWMQFSSASRRNSEEVHLGLEQQRRQFNEWMMGLAKQQQGIMRRAQAEAEAHAEGQAEVQAEARALLR